MLASLYFQLPSRVFTKNQTQASFQMWNYFLPHLLLWGASWLFSCASKIAWTAGNWIIPSWPAETAPIQNVNSLLGVEDSLGKI
mmetsp:Transcript_18822/g.38996  ORF Transcript_18822/g.38996 Transcript_18822/m.38996 type:complete len:84 (+) Transcript_18822:350-601(+)